MEQASPQDACEMDAAGSCMHNLALKYPKTNDPHSKETLVLVLEEGQAFHNQIVLSARIHSELLPHFQLRSFGGKIFEDESMKRGQCIWARAVDLTKSVRSVATLATICKEVAEMVIHNGTPSSLFFSFLFSSGDRIDYNIEQIKL
ncbi:hypothetical protein Plhal703r1_c06g0035111 [Plasmopara halstedii]